MTAIAAGTSGPVFGPAAEGRAQAFVQAKRHTSRVRWLRRAIVMAIVGASAALVLGAVYDPFRILPVGISMGDLNLNGTRITMELPKLSGFRNDGRPYAVTAKSATQDIRAPGIVDLSELKADIGMADKSRAQVVAQSGHYDSGKELLNLSTGVELTSDKGYVIKLESVDIDFHAGTMVSEQPVSVVMNNGSINSNRMLISENGKRLLFEGKVRSILLPAAEAVEANRKLKGNAP